MKIFFVLQISGSSINIIFIYLQSISCYVEINIIFLLFSQSFILIFFLFYSIWFSIQDYKVINIRRSYGYTVSL